MNDLSDDSANQEIVKLRRQGTPGPDKCAWLLRLDTEGDSAEDTEEDERTTGAVILTGVFPCQFNGTCSAE